MAEAIVDKQKSEIYAKEGYMICEWVFPEEKLQMMREECVYFLGYYNVELDFGGGRRSVDSSILRLVLCHLCKLH